jgi:zinc protease
MTLDRKTQPSYQSLSDLKLITLKSISLNNEVVVYYLPNDNLEVFRLEIIFDAGAYFGKKYGESYFTSKMLSSGTKNKTSAQISNSFDANGGFLEINQNQERLQIVLHGLTKYFETYLNELVELIYESVFPEDELELLKKVSIQSYAVSKEKTATTCNEIFRNQLFGAAHSFGKTLNEAEISDISRNDINSFYNAFIEKSAFKIFVCGNIKEKQLNELQTKLGNIKHNNNILKAKSPENTKAEKIYIDKEGSLQTSVRVGRRMFNRSHEDFYKFMVFNTLFGGYFGSRLMKNIREDKGFTYGISSSMVPLADSGYFAIGSDVKKENYAQTIEEVNKEIELLKSKKVDQEELNLVKNYMAGSIFGSINTVFDIMDKQKSIIYESLPADFYETLIPNIIKITDEDIQEMANKYMTDLTFVAVG